MCNLCRVQGRDVGVVYVTTPHNKEPQNFVVLDDKPRRFGDTVKWLCYCRCQSVAGKKEGGTYAAAYGG